MEKVPGSTPGSSTLFGLLIQLPVSSLFEDYRVHFGNKGGESYYCIRGAIRIRGLIEIAYTQGEELVAKVLEGHIRGIGMTESEVHLN
nr:hypothetical protein CFP56_07558 [Quercus suber]